MNPFQYLQDNIFYTDAKTKEINAAAARNASGKRNSSVPSMMTKGEVYGDPTPTIQPGNRPRGAMFMDPVGPSRSMPGASSFMDPVAPKDADVTQLATKPGRQILPAEETRENGNGVVQKGRNLGGGVDVAFVPEYANSSFNQLLAGVNTSGYQPFSSNQLPTTAGSPDSNIGPVTDGVVYADMLQNSPGYGTVGVGPLADGDAYARAVEGKGKSPSRLDTALSDTAGINSYMSKFSSGDKERLANRAFLDTEDSMLALRAKEAVNGVVYAGGQHFVAGETADSPAVAINRGNARDISNNKAKAEDFKAKKVAETVAAVKQSPTVLEEVAKTQAFKQDKPEYSQSTPAIGGQIEFEDSNPKNTPAFGAPTGYSSGFKRIDTSMTNPFG
jgi:hypothetical protein